MCLSFRPNPGITGTGVSPLFSLPDSETGEWQRFSDPRLYPPDSHISDQKRKNRDTLFLYFLQRLDERRDTCLRRRDSTIGYSLRERALFASLSLFQHRPTVKRVVGNTRVGNRHVTNCLFGNCSSKRGKPVSCSPCGVYCRLGGMLGVPQGVQDGVYQEGYIASIPG